jgi:hypothetical protein
MGAQPDRSGAPCWAMAGLNTRSAEKERKLYDFVDMFHHLVELTIAR